MKNIIIVILSITIVGCASSLDRCYTYTKPQKDQCVIDYFNKQLKRHGERVHKLELTNSSSRTTSLNRAESSRRELIQIATLETKRSAKEFIKKNDNTNPFIAKVIETKQNKTGKTLYRVVVEAHFNSEEERQNFYKRYKAIPYKHSKEKFNPKQIPITATYKGTKKVIASDIDSFCNELKKNYENFSAQRKDSRVIQNAKGKYEECKREQQDLRQY